MTTIKARFNGQAFVPESPVDLPIGYTLEVPIPATPPPSPESTAKPLSELSEALSRLPANADWARRRGGAARLLSLRNAQTAMMVA